MTEFSKKELEALLKDTEEHLAETKRSGPGYYGIRERYDYAVEADERYIEKLKKQIADYDLNTLNENQQVVLDWLKSVGKDMPIYRMADQLKWYIDHATTGEELDHALASLNGEEEFQVLAAFAEWGKEKVMK